MTDGMALLTFFVLAVFVGFEVVSKVSSVLHTPLMSGANAIHGVILVGAVIVTGHADGGARGGARAGRRGARDRQHGRRLRGHRPDAGDVRPGPAQTRGARTTRERHRPDRRGARLPGRRGLLHPRAQGAVLAPDRPAGQLLGAAGAVLACVVVFLAEDLDHMGPILVAIAVGTALGVPAARRVAMTQMPQLVALFNGVGGAAAALVAVLELNAGAGSASTTAAIAGAFTVLVGAVSFSGSCVTFAKLQELMTTRPVVFPGGPVAFGGVDRWSLSASPPAWCVDARDGRRQRRGCWCCSAWWRSSSACCSCCRSAARTCRSSSRCSTPSPA